MADVRQRPRLLAWAREPTTGYGERTRKMRALACLASFCFAATNRTMTALYLELLAKVIQSAGGRPKARQQN